MSVVYWIHLPEHVDMFTQGYVGVCCKSAQHRFQQHCNAARANSQNIVHRAIRKYGDSILIDTLIESSNEYCYKVENKLRPNINVGWNMAIGGKVPHGYPHTDENKEAQRQRRIGKQASEDTRKLLSEQSTGEKNNFFGKEHSQETKEKISNARKSFPQETKDRLALANGMRGKKHTPEARDKVIKTLNRDGCKGWLPWKHPRANKEMWKMADQVYDFLSSFPCSTHYKIAKALPITNKTALTIKDKIEAGWNPIEDSEWLDFQMTKG